MVTVFLTCNSGAAAALMPDASSDIVNAIAVIICMAVILFIPSILMVSPLTGNL